MALIPCPECGRQVSSAAPVCPGCGFPIANGVSQRQAPAASSSPSASQQNPYAPAPSHLQDGPNAQTTRRQDGHAPSPQAEQVASPAGDAPQISPDFNTAASFPAGGRDNSNPGLAQSAPPQGQNPAGWDFSSAQPSALSSRSRPKMTRRKKLALIFGIGGAILIAAAAALFIIIGMSLSDDPFTKLEPNMSRSEVQDVLGPEYDIFDHDDGVITAYYHHIPFQKTEGWITIYYSTDGYMNSCYWQPYAQDKRTGEPVSMDALEKEIHAYYTRKYPDQQPTSDPYSSYLCSYVWKDRERQSSYVLAYDIEHGKTKNIILRFSFDTYSY